MTGGERGFPIQPPHLEAGETEAQGGPEPSALGVGGWEVGEELGGLSRRAKPWSSSAAAAGLGTGLAPRGLSFLEWKMWLINQASWSQV